MFSQSFSYITNYIYKYCHAENTEQKKGSNHSPFVLVQKEQTLTCERSEVTFRGLIKNKIIVISNRQIYNLKPVVDSMNNYLQYSFHVLDY